MPTLPLSSHRRSSPRAPRPALLAAVYSVAALLATGPAHAQPPSRPESPQWSLGAGVVASPSPYVGVDTELIPIPLVGLRWQRLYLQGVRAGYELAPAGSPWRFDLLAQVRFQGYEADDSDFLRGMEDRDTSLDAGVRIGWEGDAWTSDLTLLSDVLDESGGQEAVLTLSRAFPVGRRLRIAPEAGLAWRSAELVEHYYGVRPEEARPFRPAYEGDSTIDGVLGVQGSYRLTGRLSLFGFVRADLLGGDVEDSPIVDDDTELTGILALSWSL